MVNLIAVAFTIKSLHLLQRIILRVLIEASLSRPAWVDSIFLTGDFIREELVGEIEVWRRGSLCVNILLRRQPRGMDSAAFMWPSLNDYTVQQMLGHRAPASGHSDSRLNQVIKHAAVHKRELSQSNTGEAEKLCKHLVIPSDKRYPDTAHID